MRGIFVLLLAVMIFAPAAIAGRVSHVEYGGNTMPSALPAPASPSVCTGAQAKCLGTVYSRCLGGYWRVMDYCKKYETCTPGGCITSRPSRFPQVKITPISMPRYIAQNDTSHGMPVQVNI